MKNIVLKVPTAIFVVLVFLPFMILVLQMFSSEELIEPKYYGILDVLGSIVTSIWLFSIVDYFQSEAPDFKFARLIYILLLVELVLDLLISFDVLVFEGMADLMPKMFQSLVFITAVVFIILLVRKVFYERSTWFIVLEILITIIGITTLTPEIKRNHQEQLAKDLN